MFETTMNNALLLCAEWWVFWRSSNFLVFDDVSHVDDGLMMNAMALLYVSIFT
jgi:hypothetical protein